MSVTDGSDEQNPVRTRSPEEALLSHLSVIRVPQKHGAQAARNTSGTVTREDNIHTGFSTSGVTQETVPNPEANWKPVIVACFLFLTIEYLDTKQSIHNQNYEDSVWKIRIYLTVAKKNMLRAVGLLV